jgi:potassium-dependent mechanosensitive channel
MIADMTVGATKHLRIRGIAVCRVIIPVGLAYGCDVSLVMERLIEYGKANYRVAMSPAPQALFLNFDASSLDFEIRLWVRAAETLLRD